MQYRSITLDDPLMSRGRNGWFRPAGVDLEFYPNSNMVRLTVYSSRLGKQDPIIVSLEINDAQMIANTLLEMTNATTD